MVIDTKKEQERDELHRAIWAIADELRGAVDVLWSSIFVTLVAKKYQNSVTQLPSLHVG